MSQLAQLPQLPQLRVVLDTNVLLSLWVFDDSRYAKLHELITAGELLPLTGTECLAEFERVLGYPEFALPAEKQRDLLADYAGKALAIAKAVAEPGLALPQCSDADDQKFLELARDGRADYLVTSDKALLKLARRKRLEHLFRILTPEGFLSRSG